MLSKKPASETVKYVHPLVTPVNRPSLPEYMIIPGNVTVGAAGLHIVLTRFVTSRYFVFVVVFVYPNTP